MHIGRSDRQPSAVYDVLLSSEGFAVWWSFDWSDSPVPARHCKLLCTTATDILVEHWSNQGSVISCQLSRWKNTDCLLAVHFINYLITSANDIIHRAAHRHYILQHMVKVYWSCCLTYIMFRQCTDEWRYFTEHLLRK